MSLFRKKNSRKFQASSGPKMGLECLEKRALLSSQAVLAFSPTLDQPLTETRQVLQSSAVAEDMVESGNGELNDVSAEVPELNSLPGAKASLYLDFDGHFQKKWANARNINTPAFDLDGDSTSFNSRELESIESIWAYVSEDFSPFNINVTTVKPQKHGNRFTYRVVVGGNSAWTRRNIGGIAIVGSFAGKGANVGFAFSAEFGGHIKAIADVTTHEAGHGFGLEHQSQYEGRRLVEEYYTGPAGTGKAPVMGNSYSDYRSVWWSGTPFGKPNGNQADMAIIAGNRNGFGFRKDDHGDKPKNATALELNDGGASDSGVISRMKDVDVFSVTAAAGTLNVNLDVAPSRTSGFGGNNLHARIKLVDSNGNVLAEHDPAGVTNFDARLSATVAAGTYFVIVSSHGDYGDVGQYTVTVQSTGGTIAAPSQRNMIVTRHPEMTGQPVSVPAISVYSATVNVATAALHGDTPLPSNSDSESAVSTELSAELADSSSDEVTSDISTPVTTLTKSSSSSESTDTSKPSASQPQYWQSRPRQTTSVRRVTSRRSVSRPRALSNVRHLTTPSVSRGSQRSVARPSLVRRTAPVTRSFRRMVYRR